MIRNIFSSLLFSIFFLTAIGQEDIHKIRNWSSFLAGKKIEGKKAYALMQQTNAYSAYSKTIHKEWKVLNKRNLKPIRKWNKKKNPEMYAWSGDVFYPFGGPDIIYPLVMFPEAKNYYLFGLEPVGELPGADIAPDSVYLMLDGMQAAVSELFNRTFFITNKMKTDFKNPYISGTLPVFLFLLKSMDCSMLDVYYFIIDENGRREVVQGEEIKPDQTHGLQIQFQKPGGQVSNLFYYHMDLSDRHLLYNPLNEKNLKMLPSGQLCFIKSGAYLLHDKKRFSKLSQYVFEKSEMILQDESGLPFKAFSQEEWNFTYYGIYDKRFAERKNFGKYYQSDLAEKYANESKGKLKFKLGYGKLTNLLKAVRR